MKRSLIVLVLLALSLSLIGGIVGAQEEEPLVIGVLTDNSGVLAIYGSELDNGFTLGIEYATDGTMTVAGRPVEVVFRDTGSDPDTALEMARELITEEGAEILVGTVSSGATLGLQQLAADFDVILMAGPAAAPLITGANFEEHTFRVCRNSYQDFLTIAPVAEEFFGGNKFVQLAADYAFGTSSAAAAEFALSQQGIEFVRDTILAPLDATDFTPYLQEVLDSGANAVIIIWAGATTVNLLQQAAELGLPEQINILQAFNSNDLMPFLVPETFTDTAGYMIYHYTFPQNEVNDWLVEHHKEAYDGDVPDLFTECAFATAQAVIAALEATDGDTLPETMIPALEGLSWVGPKGLYYIRPEDHQAMVPMYLARLTNLDDPEFRYYELLAEVPAWDILPPCEAPDRCDDYDAEALSELLQELHAELLGDSMGE